MESMDDVVDPAQCPLCGAANVCAMVVDPDAKHCWCFDATIPSDVLEQVPAAALGVACVCQRCSLDGSGRVARGS